MKIELSIVQKKELRKLWFIFGNDGPKSTLFNHKLIQGFVEYDEDRREDYEDINEILDGNRQDRDHSDAKITQECLDAIDAVLTIFK